MDPFLVAADLIVAGITVITIMVLFHRNSLKWAERIARVEEKIDHVDDCLHRIEDRIDKSDKARAIQFDGVNKRIDSLMGGK